jgi:hypothetical protein
MNENNKKGSLGGLHVATQTPVDDRIILNNYDDLLSLGINNVDAYRYYEGLIVYVLENEREYVWVESELGALPTPFTYPSNIIVNGVNYSNRTFNFVKITTAPKLTDIDVYTIDNLININYTSGPSVHFPAKDAILASSNFSVFPTLQGIAPYVGLKVLVKEQTDKTKNGDYVLTKLGNGTTQGWELRRLTYMNDDFYPRMWLVRQGPDAYKIFSQRNTDLITDQLGINGDIIFGYLELGTIITPDVKVLDTTYDELVILVNTGALIKGSLYRITDYQTIYEQPDYISEGVPVANQDIQIKMGPIEPLTVLALTNSILHCDAYQENYPYDKLKYKLDYTTHRTGAYTKGRIYERIDHNNNRTDFDHRHVLFKRYNCVVGSKTFLVDGSYIVSHFPLPNSAAVSSYETTIFYNLNYARNNYVHGVWDILKNSNNDLSYNYNGTYPDYSITRRKNFYGIKFDLPNVIINGGDIPCYNNKFLDVTYDTTILGTIINNTCTGYCLNAIFNNQDLLNNNFKNILDVRYLGYYNMTNNNIDFFEHNWLAGGNINDNNITVFSTGYYSSTGIPNSVASVIQKNDIKTFINFSNLKPTIYTYDAEADVINYNAVTGTLLDGVYPVYIYFDQSNKFYSAATATVSNNIITSITADTDNFKFNFSFLNANNTTFYIKTTNFGETGCIASTDNETIYISYEYFVLDGFSALRNNDIILFERNTLGLCVENQAQSMGGNVGRNIGRNIFSRFNNCFFESITGNIGVYIDTCSFKDSAYYNDFGPNFSYNEIGANFGGYGSAYMSAYNDNLLAFNENPSNITPRKWGNIFTSPVSGVKFGDNVRGNKFNNIYYDDDNYTGSGATYPLIIPSGFKNNNIDFLLNFAQTPVNVNYLFNYPQFKENFIVNLHSKFLPADSKNIGDNIAFTYKTDTFVEGKIFNKQTTYDDLQKYSVLVTNINDVLFIFADSILSNNYRLTYENFSGQLIGTSESVNSGLFNTDLLSNKVDLNITPSIHNPYVSGSERLIAISHVTLLSREEKLNLNFYIPSKDEMALIYAANPTFDYRLVWTSSEADQDNMWAFDWSTGLFQPLNKSADAGVNLAFDYVGSNRLIMQYTDAYGSELTKDVTF